MNGAKNMAFQYHCAGFHCAEAVLKAVLEIHGGTSEDIPRAATAFGSGIGRSKQEICGGLSGAFIAIGTLHGRTHAGMDWTYVSELAAKLRKKFIQEYGTTNCGTLLEAFGPQENMMRCKQLSGEIAKMAVDILSTEDKLQEE